ncbi:Zn-dependent protease with chaperone function [Kribbella aluminosa]|uniref:Zn-dependent protease with chaperone function n=1 Tax=Kribbella aluminosa TaxID=416017 RepID=A0ABS4UBE8_9ACTN|nr:M56 family metallopeptidase [Kribbella aluminosa]MBP2348972.1 Zn-dependent protease with chaperone function [Kribbella aluminosa]
MTVTLGLLGYAAAVAVLAPRLLTGTWMYRSPRLGLAALHAAGLSVLTSVLLAGITCVATPGRIQACLAALTGHPTAVMPPAVIAGMAVPFLLLARLAYVAARQTRRHRIDRGRHGEILSLLGRHDPELGATVIEAEEPTAYCVPGTGRIVITSGTLRVLSPAHLDAVLAHERAHLAGRHHLLVGWATILATAFPQPPLFRELRTMTAELVELLADDAAARSAHRNGLADALGALAVARSTDRIATGGLELGLAVTGGRVLARVQRLLDPPPPLSMAGRVGGAGAAVSVIALPALLVGIPAVLAAGLAACPLIFG